MANQIRAFGLRQNNPTGKSLLIFRNRVKPRNQKYSAFAVGQISARTPAIPSLRGAIARRHERGAGCGGRESVRRATAVAGRDEPHERCAACKMIGAFADGEAVWFWHPLLVLSSRRLVGPTGHRQNLNPRMTVARRIRRRGERGISRKTIARGMPGLLRCTCGDYARVLCLIRTRGCGCSWHPAFPAPSVYLGEWFLQKLGRIAPRERGHIPSRLF